MRKNPSAALPLSVGLLLSVAVALAATKTAKPPRARKADGLRGRVVFAGEAPSGTNLPMTSDPKCREQHPKGFRFQAVDVDAKGGLSEVFVYVKAGLEGRKFEAPKDKVVLDQRGCWYYPRVAGAMVGQPIEIRNSDPTMHNVNALPEFNAAMPASVKSIEKSFSQPEVMKRLKCNVHPWMTAFVGVVDNPYFAVTGKDGTFELRGLPPGRYTLEAWHETLGTRTQEVVVGRAGAKVEFKFASTEGKS